MSKRTPVVSVGILLALLLCACTLLAVQTPPTVTEDLEDPEIGVRYDYNPYTHCGLDHLRIDGELWVPVGGKVTRADANLDSEVDQGSVVLTDGDHGIYTAESGLEVPIERVIGPTPRIDGCV